MHTVAMAPTHSFQSDSAPTAAHTTIATLHSTTNTNTHTHTHIHQIHTSHHHTSPIIPNTQHSSQSHYNILSLSLSLSLSPSNSRTHMKVITITLNNLKTLNNHYHKHNHNHTQIHLLYHPNPLHSITTNMPTINQIQINKHIQQIKYSHTTIYYNNHPLSHSPPLINTINCSHTQPILPSYILPIFTQHHIQIHTYNYTHSTHLTTPTNN